MSRAILYFSIAAIVSPPPAAENALLSATARETFWVACHTGRASWNKTTVDSSR